MTEIVGSVNLPKAIYLKRESGMEEVAPEGASLPFGHKLELKFSKQEHKSKSGQYEVTIELFEQDIKLGDIIVSDIPGFIEDGAPIVVGIKVTTDLQIIASAYFPTVDREGKSVFVVSKEEVKSREDLLAELEELENKFEILRLLLSRNEIRKAGPRIDKAIKRVKQYLSGTEPDTTEAAKVLGKLRMMISDLEGKGPLILLPSKEKFNKLCSDARELITKAEQMDSQTKKMDLGLALDRVKAKAEQAHKQRDQETWGNAYRQVEELLEKVAQTIQSKRKPTAKSAKPAKKKDTTPRMPQAFSAKAESGRVTIAAKGTSLPCEKKLEFEYHKEGALAGPEASKQVIKLYRGNRQFEEIYINKIPKSIQEGDPIILDFKISADLQIHVDVALPTVKLTGSSDFSLFKVAKNKNVQMQGDKVDSVQKGSDKKPQVLPVEQRTPKKPVSQLIEKIKKIRDELRESVSGHVIAYRQLTATDSPEKIEALYDSKAEEEWLKVIEANPNDWLACHHLAILYHAKAFDLDAEGKTDEAKECWTNALAFWQKLFTIANPVDAIHNLLKGLERYKAQEDDRRLEQLKTGFLASLVNIHQKWYDHYIAQQQPDKADCHYKILERTDLPEANKIIRAIYEKKYGEQVRKLVDDIKSKREDKAKIKFQSQVDTLYKETAEVAEKRRSLSVAVRDQVILASTQFRLAFFKWRIEFVAFNEKQSAKFERLQKLKQQIEQLNSKAEKLNYDVERGDYQAYSKLLSMQKEDKRLVNEHNSILENYNRGMNSLFKKLAGLKKEVDRCDADLDRLSPYGDDESMDAAASELRDALSDISMLEGQVGGGSANQDYDRLKNRCTEVARKIKGMLSSSNPNAKGNAEEEEIPVIWQWVEFKKEDNPYKNTCFLLFEMEMPAISDIHDVNALFVEMKKKKGRLENKAKGKKHQVLGRTILPHDLNKAMTHLESPVDFAKDILLQHQAHKADIEAIKSELNAIQLPSPDEVKLELAPAVFNLFASPTLPKDVQRQWKKPAKEPPVLKIKPEIEWPT